MTHSFKGKIMICDVDCMIRELSVTISGWPFIAYIIGASIFCTIAFKWVQFRFFIDAVRYTLFPEKQDTAKGRAELSPIQAFINSLGIGLGNGSIAGMATAIYTGGPGAIFWLVCIGILLMSVRFAEVYLSVYYADIRARVGGPLIYLKQLYGGTYMAYLYAVLALCYAHIVGNAIQTNAISISLQEMTSLNAFTIAIFFLLFVLYMMYGGADRILTLSDKIVPLKVVIFFVSSFIVLAFHVSSIIPAIMLIVHSAFTYTALAGGAIGFTVQQAIRVGIFRCVMSTEAGLGTSGILFGSTESKKPVHDGLMSLLTVFISTVVNMLVGICIVASGVWDSGLTSTALTIAAFKTVFGQLGGWIVTALSISFGLGVMVSYAFVARTIWLYLTSNRYVFVINGIYCLFACIGALCNPYILWSIGDIINVGMILLNVSAVIVLSKIIIQGLQRYIQSNKRA